MAKIIEENIIIKISKIVADESTEGVDADDIIETLRQITNELPTSHGMIIEVITG